MLDQLLELSFDSLDALFELADLTSCLGKSWPEEVGDRGLGVFEEGPDVRHDVVGTEGDGQAKLAQDPT